MSSFVVSASPAFAAKEAVPAGSHISRCVGLVVIGDVTSFNKIKGQNETKPKVSLEFELPEITHEYDGKEEPRIISRRYNLTLHENSALFADLCSWRGKKFTAEELKGFDLRNILGAPAMLNVTHETRDGKEYANIANISPCHKSIVVPAAVTPLRKLGYGEDWSWEVFEGLPKFLKELMMTTPQFKAIESQRPGGALPAAEAASVAKAEAPAAKSTTPAPVGEEDDNEMPF